MESKIYKFSEGGMDCLIGDKKKSCKRSYLNFGKMVISWIKIRGVRWMLQKFQLQFL